MRFSKEQGQFNQLYIYDCGSIDRPKVEYGHMRNKGGKLIRNTDIADMQGLMYEVQELFSKNPKNEGIFFHIHGFKADRKSFISEMCHVIEYEIAPANYLIISLQWTSPLSYDAASQTAKNKGTTFGMLINQILEILPVQINLDFLCHSMGNIVFQGIYDQLKPAFTLQKCIHDVALIGADLPVDIMELGFEDLSHNAHSVHVFYNKHDRVLHMANALRPWPRLGIFGANKDVKQRLSNYFEYDMSQLDDVKGIKANLFRHRYHLNSASAKSKIQEAFKTKYVPLYPQ